MKIFLAIIIIAATSLAAFIACEEAAVGPRVDPSRALVFGRVMTFRPWPGPMDYVPYTEFSSRQATVKLQAEDGQVHGVVTDSSSRYLVALDTGYYTVTVETWHSWPDRYPNVHIGQDTSIDLEVYIDYHDADSVVCSFEYASVADSLGREVELQYLHQLNEYSGYCLRPTESRRFIWEFDSTGVIVDYCTPVEAGMYVWEACDKTNRQLYSFPWIFPEELVVKPITYLFYICSGQPCEASKRHNFRREGSG